MLDQHYLDPTTLFSDPCRNTSPFEDHNCIFLVSAVEGTYFQLTGSWEVPVQLKGREDERLLWKL